MEEAKNQLASLKRNSKELNLRLEQVEKSLDNSKQELMNSNASLEKLKSLLEETQASLSLLTNQINDEREKEKEIQNRLRIQKVIVGILCFYVGKAVG